MGFGKFLSLVSTKGIHCSAIKYQNDSLKVGIVPEVGLLDIITNSNYQYGPFPGMHELHYLSFTDRGTETHRSVSFSWLACIV